MLGNVAPRALRVTSQPVVYSGRDNVTRLTLEVLSGRRYAPLDLSAVTRWLLVFPERDPQVLIDSTTEAVFSATGNVLTVYLSGYAIDASIQPCWLIAYDAEHPMGQVLVDNVDCVVSFDFRAVSGAGLAPLPLVEYVTAAPADGKKYLQQNGGWVEATALVSGVSTVNGQTGDVVLTAASVGAEPAGTASSAVGAHVAAPDPHPQYLTPAEGNAAYDALGAASSAIVTHVLHADPHAQYALDTDLANHVGATGSAHGVATADVAGFMAPADKSKLDGVAAGATANSSDATLLARANHTGEQAISTVTGLQAALDGKASTAQVIQSIIVACSDETTALTAGTAKVTFRMPYAFTLTGVRAALTTAQTSGSILTVDLNEAGVSVLSTKLTIDNGEKTSVTAATAAVINDSALADDAEMTVDIDQVGDGTAKGLKITLLGYRP